MNLWKRPEEELPKDGEEILIREYYKSPKHGQFRNNFRVITFFDEYGFELEEKRYKHIFKYKITHWMSIPPIKS